MEIIIGRQGNQKTPIFDKSVSRQHCKVFDNGDGTFTIENLSSSGTKVDGVEIIRTKATLNSRLQLGPNFTATLVELIGAPAQNRPQPQPVPQLKPKQEFKTFDISHLKLIWEEYYNTNIELAEEQKKGNNIRTASSLLTLGAGTAGSVLTLAASALAPVAIPFAVAGVVGSIYGHNKAKNAQESTEERQRRQEEFMLKWVCPNPECGKPLPMKPFRVLVEQHKTCQYCKCKFVVK